MAANGSIPGEHKGTSYYEFMSELSAKRGVERYLEIGVNEGGLMSRIHATRAVGVDPEYVLSANVAAHKKAVTLVQESSDRFFALYDYHAIAGGAPDLCFLDGFHTFEFLLRDFINTEAICSKTSLICLHDCLPLNDTMTIRDPSESLAESASTKFANWWTGDVWKIIPILQHYRPDLELVMIDCSPTGVVCITNLDPASRVLSDAYLEIVRKYHKVDNIQGELEKLYGSFEMTSASSVMKSLDNTIFFRT